MQQEYNYTPLPEPIPITEQVWPEGTLPLVCTSTLAYNHEPFIRECLDGILMQKTTFPVQVLVHEDCSTDRTAEILKEYQAKYPNLIKVFYQPENVYSLKDQEEKRKRRAEFNSWRTGKYIALCEGDDYWIDPLKLQKQVEFLEENNEFSMCFTNAEILFDGIINLKSDDFLYNHLKTKSYSGNEILKKWTVPTASVIFRNYFKEGKTLPIDKRFMFGDIIIFLWLAESGKLWCVNDKTVVYRRNLNGLTYKKFDYKKRLNHYLAIRENFGAKYEKTTKFLIAKSYIGGFITGKLGIQSVNVLKDILKNRKYLPLFIVYLPLDLFKSISNKIKLNIYKHRLHD
mgnify:CR=1 FL=1